MKISSESFEIFALEALQDQKDTNKLCPKKNLL